MGRDLYLIHIYSLQTADNIDIWTDDMDVYVYI